MKKCEVCGGLNHIRAIGKITLCKSCRKIRLIMRVPNFRQRIRNNTTQQIEYIPYSRTSQIIMMRELWKPTKK